MNKVAAEMTDDSPPTYVEATRDGPPTYQSLFAVKEIQEAKESSSNKGMFAAKVFEILCGSIACLCCLLCMAALPVAMVVIGSIYLYDCKGQDKIPIWLIVFGVISLCHTLISIFKRCAKEIAKKTSSEDDDNRNQSYASRSGSTCESLLSLFLFIWLIVGSVWVFSYFYNVWNVYNCTADPNGDSRCNCDPVVFMFSYITLIVIYAASLLICVCGCCCFCGAAIFLGGRSTSEK